MTKTVNYKFSIAVMCLIAGIILFIVCCAGIKLGIFCQRKYNESNIYSEWDFAAFGAWLFSAIGILCSISMIFYNIVTIITCKTFPEKVIIDMVQSYLK